MTAVRTDHGTADRFMPDPPMSEMTSEMALETLMLDRVSRRWVNATQRMTADQLQAGLFHEQPSERLDTSISTGLLLNESKRRALGGNQRQMMQPPVMPQQLFTPEQSILDEAEHERVPSRSRTPAQRGQGWDGD